MPPTRQCRVRTISRDRATLILLYNSWPKPPSDSVNRQFPSLKKFTMNSAHQKHFHLKQTLSNTCSHNKGYDAYQLSTEKVIPGLH